MSDTFNDSQHVDATWRYSLEKQNVIEDQNVFRNDVDLQRRIFLDACRHAGYKVEYFEADFEKRDIYQDPVTRWKPAIILPCIFEDHPKVKVLKELGWFEADQELQGQILYLPMYKNWETKEILDLKDQSLFRVTYFGQNYPADFRLSDKRLDSVYGVYWICKLAPEHLDNFYYVTNHGTHFLKKKEDDTVTCEHKKQDSEQQGTDERVFQHQDLESYLFGKSGETPLNSRPYPDTIISDETKTYSQLIMEDGDD